VALETIAAADPDLMRRVWRVALEAYTTARATYHVSATAAGAPSSDGASAEALGRLLVDPNTREILHVTYGAVLQRRFGRRRDRSRRRPASGHLDAA